VARQGGRGRAEPAFSNRRLPPHREDTFTEDQTVVVNRKGSVLIAHIRELGKRCNNGRLSRLEDRAKPLLRRLWSGVGGPPLSVDDAAFLSTWATKTAWMHERVSVEQPTATGEIRGFLRIYRATAVPHCGLGRAARRPA
jgi:hypothetical protein